MTRLIFGLLGALMLLTGCSTMKPADFANGKPVFDLHRYFEGKTNAYGLFEARFGKDKNLFRVDINGEVKGKDLILTEHFTYADGKKETRVWTITDLGGGRYEGRAADVVGVAKGVSAGNAFNWNYVLDLKTEDGSWKLDFDDWMYLQDGNVIINRAKVTKFGVRVGDVSIFFSKPGA